MANVSKLRVAFSCKLCHQSSEINSGAAKIAPFLGNKYALSRRVYCLSGYLIYSKKRLCGSLQPKLSDQAFEIIVVALHVGAEGFCVAVAPAHAQAV